MSRRNRIFLQFLTLCLLFGSPFALFGKKVRNTEPDKYLYVVSISNTSESLRFENHHFCTGTLVTHKRIVTAAHCLEHRELDNVEIIAGNSNLKQGTKYYPDSWTLFDHWTKHNGKKFPKSDIAVIKLKGEGITEIHPVEFLSFNSVHRDDRQFTLMGWGETIKGNKVTTLRKGLVKIISNKECSEKGTALQGKTFTVPPNYFCTKADPYVLSSCGDGGAPILNKEEKLIGINRGICPSLEGYFYNASEFLNGNLMNAHLAVYPYINFLLHA